MVQQFLFDDDPAELKKKHVLEGRTVVINVKTEKALEEWAAERGLFVYIGRANPRQGRKASKWQNSHKMREDTSRERDQVCDAHIEELNGSPELLEAIPELRGKVLGCWCKPRRCHGDYLAELANRTEEPANN